MRTRRARTWPQRQFPVPVPAHVQVRRFGVGQALMQAGEALLRASYVALQVIVAAMCLLNVSFDLCQALRGGV